MRAENIGVDVDFDFNPNAPSAQPINGSHIQHRLDTTPIWQLPAI
jgi:hypothetical protein